MPNPERRSSDWADPLFGAVLAAAFLWFFVTRSQIELKRPVPWSDEGSFLWQALAFRDNWTLFAPELHPARHVLWMPPGFMVLEGAIFKILPFSLNAARSLSALFLCSAFACLAASFRRFRSAFGLLPVTVVFLFSPIFLVVGNVARMESLVLFVSMAGFLLFSRNNPVGLAVLALAPLVHPNGFFPLVGGVLYFLATFRERRPIPRPELVAFAVVALAWAAYGVYVAMHFPAFLEDIGNQLRSKKFVSSEGGGASARVRMPIVVVPVVLLALAAGFSRRLQTKTGAIAMLAAVFFVQSVLASGWLYEAYLVFALLLATIVVVETTAAILERATLENRSRTFALISVCVLAALVDRTVVHTPFLKRSLARTTVERPTLAPVYFTPADYDAVASTLKGLERDMGTISVQFIPEGEGLLFEKLRSKTLRFAQQTLYAGYFNVVVVHESVWSPRNEHELQLLHVFSMHPNQPESTAFRSRDRTEHFLAFRWKPGGAGTAQPEEKPEVNRALRGAEPP
jgi:hypothetical protein